jgi:tyrosinase
MYVRKNLVNLTPLERKAFIDAVLALKEHSRYDQYIEWHHHAMMCATPLPNENPHWRFRNAAHRGPAFLPFHRDYILCFERDLQAIDPTITLPYWDWTADANLADPATAPIWSEDFMGGTGSPDNDFEVKNGPFAHDAGQWNIPVEFEGPKLRRGLGQFKDPFGILIDTLPSDADLKFLWEEVIYDAPLWAGSPFIPGFRNRIEGWVTRSADHRVRSEGVQLHNRVHVWVGGTMSRPVSPGDPVFFLHHCFVDKLWAEWQMRLATYYADPMNHSHDPLSAMTPSPGFYLPMSGGPTGHNLCDRMFPPPWDHTRAVRPCDMVDHRALGYCYDTDVAGGPPPHDHQHEVQRAFAA